MNSALTEPRTGPSPAAGAHSTWRAPFAGLIIAVVLLGAVESCLHADWFLYRYRSVFAAGRAMDKLLALERGPPSVLAVGNSRVDNGFHPRIFKDRTGLKAFNLGLPGAEACNVEGVLERLSTHGAFGKGRIEAVLFGLDEAYFQRTGGLGYEVFFDLPARLLEQGRYVDWLRSRIRLWGYTDSLRTLQEPAKLVRFAEASVRSVESWGGNARDTSGFRAADEVTNQDAAQIRAQDRARHRPPNPELVQCFKGSLDRLLGQGVKVAVFPTPSLLGPNPFAGEAGGAASPYARLKQDLAARGIEFLEPEVGDLLQGSYFANPGHLNREGATRFTTRLASALVPAAASVGAD